MRAAVAAGLVAVITIAGTSARQAVLPRVIAALVPQYPAELAKAGIIGGTVITVTTDGTRLTDARIVSATGTPSTFHEATLRNLKTWRFAPHTPTSFQVNFRYTIVNRPCDSLGRNAHAAAVMKYPTDIEVFTERDQVCDGFSPLPPVFGIYIREAAVPFYPDAAREGGIQGTAKIGVTYKGVLSLEDGPPELGDPIIESIRDWMLVPGPFSENMNFTFKLVDNDCRGGGPTVTVGPGMTSYEVVDKRSASCR